MAAMHPQNAIPETAPEHRSPRPRTGEPNATFGCTEASTPSSQCFNIPSVNVRVVPSLAEATSATWHYQGTQQFSITAVTTSSGCVAERYAYTACGQPTILDGSGSLLSSSAINNRYTYTGREWDATLDLCYFRARWMSGLAGRFMGRYPIGYDGSEWRLNEFLDSEVTSYVDPAGESKCRSILIYPTGKDRRGKECSSGVPRAFVGGRYVGCFEWEFTNSGLTISTTIKGTAGTNPSAKELQLHVVSSSQVSCSCQDCECLPNPFSASDKSAFNLDKRSFWQVDQARGKVADSFGVYTWLNTQSAGGSMFIFGGAGWNHDFLSHIAIPKGTKKGKNSESIFNVSKLFYASWSCAGDCPKKSSSNYGS